ncbi:hypothetical protein Pan241w_32950 [Gimesia alba]|uniref:Cytochrome C n=1 Tax=Gimesia alba TaxID=2527973 RepID=A0A517RH59_9PLAN|nr:hypothetical protein [Gimesia alba]QDT43195.1 hypothetical protein Pan241w_32950 [Gimesia alba]
MNKKTPYILIAVACISAFALNGYAEKNAPKKKGQKNATVSKKDKSGETLSEKDRDFWMQAKLLKSQTILAALTEGDFKSVEKNARALRNFGILESWLRNSPETSQSEYKAQLNKFEFANKELIRMAEDKNADGAATAFAAITITCVKCHKLIRDVDEK